MSCNKSLRAAACAALVALPAVAVPDLEEPALPATAGARRVEHPEDPALRILIDESLAASPEVAEARAAIAADEARVPQAGALPDPSLSAGIQNDGFTRIAIGSAETSFVSLALTQPFYWPGKRGLREEVIKLDVSRARARLARAELDVESRARRAYLDLQLARGQRGLLADQQSLWRQSEQLARARYEAGQVPQSDVLRAQLELARLDQRAWSLQAQEGARLAEIARLRGAPIDQGLAVSALEAAAPEAPPTEEVAWTDAQERSPELLVARIGIEQSGRRTELMRKEQRPDMAITAGVMARGTMEPMWQVGFSIGLPAWSGRKQRLAVVESEQRQIAEQQGRESVSRSLLAATRARLLVWASLMKTEQQYREGLLVLSEASARSTLAQYEVGKLPFASVLESLSGYFADRAGYLDTLAGIARVAIAQRELSLDVPAAGGTAVTAGSMPGGGSRSYGISAPSQSATPTTSTSPAGMSGM